MTPQLTSFLLSVLCGACAMVLWAVIGAVRDSVRVGVFPNGIMDVIWWVAAVVLFCTAMWRSSSMDLRFFEFVGVGLGAVLCRFTIQTPLRRLFSVIFQFFFENY